MNDGRLRRAAVAGTIAAVVAAIVALQVPICPFAAVTHLPCPGCGLTRATLALAHGDFVQGIAMHPLAPVLSPFVALYAAANAYSYIRFGRFVNLEGALDRWTTRGAAALFVVLLGVWIARFFGALGGPVAV